MGHSLGGAAAIHYAAAHPQRVAGLVLVGTPGRMPAEQSKPIIASMAAARRDDERAEGTVARDHEGALRGRSPHAARPPRDASW